MMLVILPCNGVITDDIDQHNANLLFNLQDTVATKAHSVPLPQLPDWSYGVLRALAQRG